jgi:hypothetical protein
MTPVGSTAGLSKSLGSRLSSQFAETHVSSTHCRGSSHGSWEEQPHPAKEQSDPVEVCGSSVASPVVFVPDSEPEPPLVSIEVSTPEVFAVSDDGSSVTEESGESSSPELDSLSGSTQLPASLPGDSSP